MDRNSTTKPDPDTISPVKRNTRRNSLAPSNSSTSSNNRLNYLRASTGSCHDFCKYGKEQSFEQTSRNPLQRRLVSRPPDNQILMRSAISPDRKKKSPTLRPKSASGSESRNFDGNPGVRKEKASKPDSRKSLLNGSLADNKKKETSVLYPKSSSATSSVLSNPRKTSKDDTPVIKQLSKKVLPQGLSKSSNLPVRSISGPPRLSSTVNRLSLNPQRANDKERKGKSREVSVDVQKNVSGGKRSGTGNVLPRMSLEKQKPNKVNAISKADVMDETLCVPNEETKPIEIPVSGVSVADRNESGSDMCVSSETPVSVATSLGLSTSPALNFQEEDQMEHESGFILSSKLNCPVLSSQEEYETESDSEDYYSDSDNEENPSMQLEEEEISQGDRQAYAARTRASLPEGLESNPMKLRFRRGKIIDLQFEKDNSPRRLKFRRGRTLEENRHVSGKTRKKSANIREVESGDSDKVDPSEKVVLRHNDLQERKDGQASLLNIVIEETASKLVEARKSKVKALVGAFETVISLHDTKPSAGS